MNAQIERILDEIAWFSPEERLELALALPRVLPVTPVSNEPDQEMLEQEGVNWERFHARLRAEGRSFGSISDDLEMLCEGTAQRAS